MSSPPLDNDPQTAGRPTFHVARHTARSKAEVIERDDVEDPVPPEIHRSALAVRIVVSTLTLVAVGVVALLGGFERDPSATAGPPAFPVGQAAEAGVLTVTIHSARSGKDLHGHRSKDGTHQFAVEVTILNRGDRTLSLYNFKVIAPKDIPGVDKFTTAHPARLPDESLTADLQPGLPIRLALIWDIADTTPVPSRLTVEVEGVHPTRVFASVGGEVIDFPEIDGVATIPVST